MEANASVRERIVRWNEDLQYDLIPNNLILAMYIFLGIFGNSTVIYVYRKRFSRKNNDRYFIPILAAIDLFGSVICGSFGIALNMMQATFYNDSLCKTWWFFAAFITYESQLLLVVIAVQRYLKVVRPFGRHMDQKLSHTALLLTFIISLLLAIPTSILYGSVSFPHPKLDIDGRRCSKIKSGNKVFSILYSSLIGLIAITIVSALVGMYSRIGWTIYKHTREMRKESEISRNDRDSSKTTDISINTTDSNSDMKQKEIVKSVKEERSVEEETEQQCKKDNLNNGEVGHLSQNQREQKNRKIMHKFSLMFMLITSLYLICYITKVIIMLFEALDPHFWEGFDNQERVGMLFAYRIYIANCIINPFIYAFLDTKFKHELLYLCCRRKN